MHAAPGHPKLWATRFDNTSGSIHERIVSEPQEKQADAYSTLFTGISPVQSPSSTITQQVQSTNRYKLQEVPKRTDLAIISTVRSGTSPITVILALPT